MNFKALISVGMILVTTTAFAHQNVQNPTVKARMDAMSAIAANMKSLASVAKAETSFDAEQVRSILVSIADHAASTPDLFRENADDPVSEALPLIWQDFDDFIKMSDDLRVLASQLSTSIAQPTDVGSALRSIGESCKACHGRYRE